MADFLLILPVLLFSVAAHEAAHAWTAWREGDHTAQRLGRLTLNPLKHIDPVMSVLVPLVLWKISSGAFTFGAARAVPVNPANYRNPVRGDIIVSSAGMIANLMLAGAFALLFVAAGVAGQAASPGGWVSALQSMCTFGIMINLLLAFFNLIPLPPLDGSHLLVHALPRGWRDSYRKAGRYGFLVLVLSLWLLPQMWSVLLWPAGELISLAQRALAPWALAR